MSLRIVTVALLLLSLTALQALAAEAAPKVNWSTRDSNGEEVRVPGSTVSVLLFAMADQSRSQDSAKQLAEAVKTGTANVIVVVSGQSASDGAHRFVVPTGNTWAVVTDGDYSASGTFNVHVWPTTVIVSPDGTVAGHVAGFPKSYLSDVDAHLALAAGRIDQAELERRLAGQTVIGDDPEQMAARHLIVADRLLEKGLKEEAQRELDAAINIHPASTQSRFQIARDSLALGRTADAVAVLDTIPSGAVSPSQMNLLRGKALCAQGKWDSAVSTLVDATKLNPQPAEAWYALARAYDKLNEPAKAAEAYRFAFESTDLGKKLREQ